MASSSSSSNLDQDLAFLIGQFLDEHNFKESARTLEKEAKLYINMKYVEEAVTEGKWKELESYISSFTKIGDNAWSDRTIFEIRKQNYIEALENGQHANALEILTNGLYVFAGRDKQFYKEVAELISKNNVRENEKLAKNDEDTKRHIYANLRMIIEMNPVLSNKLKYPSLEDSRLKILMNHSMNWQHALCKYPDPNPTSSTLYVDHSCGDMKDGALGNFTHFTIDARELSRIPKINQPAQLCFLRLPDPISSPKVCIGSCLQLGDFCWCSCNSS